MIDGYLYTNVRARIPSDIFMQNTTETHTVSGSISGEGWFVPSAEPNYICTYDERTSLTPAPYCVHFRGKNGNVGVLKIVDGQLKFEGNADESAKLFFDIVCRQFLDEKKSQNYE